jgi:hypothetical protein
MSPPLINGPAYAQCCARPFAREIQCTGFQDEEWVVLEILRECARFPLEKLLNLPPVPEDMNNRMFQALLQVVRLPPIVYHLDGHYLVVRKAHLINERVRRVLHHLDEARL